MLDLIKKLRQETGCSIGECKKAIEEAFGDYEKASRVLTLSASKTAAKKAHRETKEGIIATYLHTNNKIGVLVELLSETDFVAKNALFSELAHSIALHIAAMNPLYIRTEDIPKDAIELITREA
ncbi:MAG: elongation factor Ts, partial [Patescibacteria group bacterium]